ncbi:glycosyltransferase family 4 protein, partial [Algibacter sp.]
KNIFESNLKIINVNYYKKINFISKLTDKFMMFFGSRAQDLRRAQQIKRTTKKLKKEKLPVFDIAYVEYASNAIMLMQYFKEFDIPFVVHVHGYDVTSRIKDDFYLKNLKKVFALTKNIITPSLHLKRYLILLGCPALKIKVVYPFIILEDVQPLNWKHRYELKPNITFLGRLTAKKNPIALILAFALVLKKRPEIVMNILGNGELMEACKLKVKDLGIDKSVCFHGVINRQKGFEILNNSWVYTQHSVTALSGDQEGFPVSLAEAALHGLPIVSTIHSGITENVIDGVTGFVVQEYDYVKMADKILYLIENPKKAQEMGDKGREHIIDLCKEPNRISSIKKILFHTFKK